MKQAQEPSPEPSAAPGVPAPQDTLTPENPNPGPAAVPSEMPEGQSPAVPEILLEGDEPEESPPEAPPAKFVAAAAVDQAHKEPGPSRLPEAYGTGELLLLARDSGSLYAHWDFTTEQQQRYEQQSVDGRLWLRLHRETVNGRPVAELPAEPASNHSFIPVTPGPARYAAELGYRPADGSWKGIAASSQVIMPGWTPPDPGPVQFGTLTFEPSAGWPPGTAEPALPAQHAEPAAPLVPPPDFERRFPLPPPLRPLPQESLSRSDQAEAAALIGEAPQAAAREILPAAGPLSLRPAPDGTWTEAQESALAALIGSAVVRAQGPDSAEIAELLRARAPVSPMAGAGPELPGQVTPPPSSGLLAQAPAESRAFWLNVNAELVLYGSTTAEAQLTIGGQPVAVRQDGSFTCRFALPDGVYSLPVVAISAQGEMLQAELDFSRRTNSADRIGSAPADPSLNAPLAPPVAPD